ncbi:hypothetical protein PR048_032735 [Dryococelus australis]|uniref:Uncharacterized protein n=1 Tax=Dryococelus australis TaxID=614101 RepID=A0ABQ9G320_9NEOP|nr:hypothetical protein PR048_032735 [Dryococelus australis]
MPARRRWSVAPPRRNNSASDRIFVNRLLYTVHVQDHDGNTARLARRSDEALGVHRGGYGAAAECKVGRNSRSPRKPADQRNAKIQGATPPGTELGSPWWGASSLTTTPPRPINTHSNTYWNVCLGCSYVPLPKRLFCETSSSIAPPIFEIFPQVAFQAQIQSVVPRTSDVRDVPRMNLTQLGVAEENNNETTVPPGNRHGTGRNRPWPVVWIPAFASWSDFGKPWISFVALIGDKKNVKVLPEAIPKARLYSLMYKYDDIKCTLVVCCHMGRQQLGQLLQKALNTALTNGYGGRNPIFWSILPRRQLDVERPEHNFLFANCPAVCFLIAAAVLRSLDLALVAPGMALGSNRERSANKHYEAKLQQLAVPEGWAGGINVSAPVNLASLRLIPARRYDR